MKGPRIGMLAVIILLLILVAAWIDGGEEPLRSISQDVPYPEGAQ